MVKIYKPGRVVICLSGRSAGKKGLVIKSHDEGGTQERPYEHAIVVGIERYPKRVREDMSLEKIKKKSKLKPFIRTINLKHLMPTRYSATDIVFDKITINKDTLKDPAKRKRAKHAVKMVLEDRYKSGKNRWFFQPLRY